MFTTNGTYPWSFVTQIYHSGQSSHGGDRKILEMMTVRVSRSLVLCVCFVDRCFSFSPYSFGICVVCHSSNYGF
jgi:hypothetical protein